VSGHDNIRRILARSVPAALMLASIGVAVLCGELLARLVVNPGDHLFATLIEDAALGHRIEPRTTGHDALGFRNLELPEHAEIVAIGDSTTYGYGVIREESWPYQLGTLLDEPVYNMALGGYGPLQYLHLAANEAKKLHARQLIVGLYLGNDIADSYGVVQQNPYWAGWREPGSERAVQTEYQRSMDAASQRRFAALRDWLSRNSVLFSILRAALPQWLVPRGGDRATSQLPPDRQFTWKDRSDSSVGTVFTPQLRLSALDPQLPSVQQGLRITKRAIAALRDDARAHGTQVLVVLIPTKERAYCPYLRESGEHLPEPMLRMCDSEGRVKQDLVQFFKAESIAHVDVTKVLEELIRQHVQVFSKDADAHPTAKGYGAIARAVYDAMRRPNDAR
jgi:lysophospholipase L1-like esterase